MDVRRDSLVLANLKNPSRTTKRVFLPAAQMDLPRALLLWAREHELLNDKPIFFSRKRTVGGARRSISRRQAWEIVRAAPELANVRVLALRASQYGVAGGPAPVHPHLFRHARVRQIVRHTKSLALAQKTSRLGSTAHGIPYPEQRRSPTAHARCSAMRHPRSAAESDELPATLSRGKRSPFP